MFSRPPASDRRPWYRALATGAAVVTLATAGSAAFSSGSPATYVVRPGDTLSGVAGRFHLAVATLSAANNLSDPNAITAGEVLILPGPSGHTASGRYRVAAGDTLSGIATRVGVAEAALITANHLAPPYTIYVGQSLRLSGSSAASAPAVATGPLTRVDAPGAGSPRFPLRLLAHPSRLALRPVFRHWAAASGVPTGLLEALAWMESGWQSNVVSSTGAIGIGQLEPSTVVFTSQTLLGLARPLDPRQPDANIEMSAFYLAYMLRAAHGNVANALGGYYQGTASLMAVGPFADTRQYVATIGGLWGAFRSG